MTLRLLVPFLCLAALWPGAARAATELDDTARLLQALSDAHGPSGFEGPVRAIMRDEMAGLADRIETDGLGSLIAVLEYDEDAPNIMIAAHLDEVGLIVKRITDDGYLKIQTLGGILPQALINQRFLIRTQTTMLAAVSGLKTIHVMPRGSARDFMPTESEIFLDVGATNREDALERLGIQPGDPIAFDTQFEVLNGGDLYLGKAWDDRVGLAVMVETMKRLAADRVPANVFFVSTVQEEIGLRGAKTSSYQVAPDIGISLEAGVAADYPSITRDEAQEVLGGGPGMFLMDASMIPNRKLTQLVIDVAHENGIPLQRNVQPGYGEDGAEMQKVFTGTPAVNLTVPTRYLHTHYGLIHRRDFDGLVDLLTALVRRLTPETIESVQRFGD
jgi:endoglucanase